MYKSVFAYTCTYAHTVHGLNIQREKKIFTSPPLPPQCQCCACRMGVPRYKIFKGFHFPMLLYVGNIEIGGARGGSHRSSQPFDYFVHLQSHTHLVFFFFFFFFFFLFCLALSSLSLPRFAGIGVSWSFPLCSVLLSDSIRPCRLMPMRSHASRPVNITAAFAYSLRNAGQSLHGLLWVRVKRSSILCSYGSRRIGISRHMRHEFGPPCDPSVNIRPLLWPRVHSGIWSSDVQCRTVAHIVVYLCAGARMSSLHAPASGLALCVCTAVVAP